MQTISPMDSQQLDCSVNFCLDVEGPRDQNYYTREHRSKNQNKTQAEMRKKKSIENLIEKENLLVARHIPNLRSFQMKRNL